MNEHPQFEALLTDVDVGLLLGGLHPKTVQRMARAGTIPAVRIGRYWRYRSADLVAWIDVQSSSQLARVPS
jgi:excisionase family DNA binding protein